MSSSRPALTTLASAVIAFTFLAQTAPVANAAPDRKAGYTAWLDLARQAGAESETAYTFLNKKQNVPVWFVSPVAAYRGRLSGWKAKDAQYWLQQVYNRHTPSGGYGLGAPWDWGNNKTTNPASTAYSITTAWHVGRTLIEGYDAGVVDRRRLLTAVTSILNTATRDDGRCVAYSNSGHDTKMPCVWNINATAAWFLWQAARRNAVPVARRQEALDKSRAWRDFTRAHYRVDLNAWPYASHVQTRQDPWHNAATVGPMYELDREFGVQAMDGHFTVWPANSSNVDLVIYDCARIRPGLLGDTRRHALPAVDGDPWRQLQSRSRWGYMALRLHQTCFTNPEG